ncbi:MAG: PilC/PilY family type IV pilus protein [Gammaproteobacteria bacterium]|nr:PilC/PilY family type IV pilus protein [Gammaproteobacteria bacterium]
MTGDLVAKIPTNDATPNGLAAPFVTDWPAADLRASRVYAGDLRGNLWVFDLSSSNSNQWDNAGNRRILFTATDDDGNVQPITSRPYGARPASGEVIVAFGTGSYFRLSDKDDEGIQSLYGIIDPANPGNDPQPVSRADELLEQEIITQVSLDADEGEQPDVVRLVSSHVPDPEVHKGWYLDLDAETGERVISGPRALGRVEQRVRFTTLIPDEDPCGSGRRGFLMDISLATGGRVEVPVFDLSGDFRVRRGRSRRLRRRRRRRGPERNRFRHRRVAGSGRRAQQRPAGGSDHQIVCDGRKLRDRPPLGYHHRASVMAAAAMTARNPPPAARTEEACQCAIDSGFSPLPPAWRCGRRPRLSSRARSRSFP